MYYGVKNDGKYYILLRTLYARNFMFQATRKLRVPAFRKAYWFYGAEPLRSRQSLSYWRIPQYFVKPEGSLPCSQEPSAGSYPEADEFSPYHLILFL
jgi:hypothetical protein